MGTCLSVISAPKGNLIDEPNGNELDYNENFLEDKILGEGEFGVVKLVHPLHKLGGESDPLAVKILHKGLTFKDNTLYAPLSPKMLRLECAILRKLGGTHFTLKLHSVFESSSLIYLITEFLPGGEMMEWVSRCETDLSTSDVSRIAFQLLDAVNHCAFHGVIHRDIKPENVMFKTHGPKSDLRLIDFGSSTMDDVDMSKYEIDRIPGAPMKTNDQTIGTANGDSEHATKLDPLLVHTTFAGSAFYISPEMFQHQYTHMTDVWSAGVTLYVLVAGFPAETMQAAFNMLQSSGSRNLRELPNMPTTLPDSYFEMLEKMLTYKYKKRTLAKDVLDYEFINLHKTEVSDSDDGDDDSAAGLDLSTVLNEAENFESTRPQTEISNGTSGRARSKSGVVVGSVRRHSIYLGYKKCERSITTLLATVLTKEEFTKLLETLEEKLTNNELLATEKMLRVIKIKDLKGVLNTIGLNRATVMMEKLPNSSSYESFAYRISLLNLFTPQDEGVSGQIDKARYGSKIKNANLDDSTHGHRPGSNSVHGNNVYESWKGRGGGGKKAMKMKKDLLGSSVHN